MKCNVWICLLALGLSSCANIGPRVLPPDRLSYNRSLENSDEQQSLLNIVRLRYTDPPYFLAVNNVVSQFNYGNDFSVNVSNSTPPPSLLGSGNASFNYSEAPTITYTPLQGSDYVTKLLTPIDLSVIFLLIRSGWSVNHIMRILVQQVGTIENAVLADRAISSRAPIYKEFLEMGLLFKRLERHHHITIAADTVDGKFAIKVHIKHYALLTAKERALFLKLGVTADSPMFWFVSQPAKQKKHVFVRTRTVLGLLNYLSKGVDIPKSDIAKKQVPMTILSDGRPFDWHQVTVGMIRIRTSSFKPTNAFAAVTYRGSWFYVPFDDFYSKETLSLLCMIMGIYQGDIKSVLPVFTVS